MLPDAHDMVSADDIERWELCELAEVVYSSLQVQRASRNQRVHSRVRILDLPDDGKLVKPPRESGSLSLFIYTARWRRCIQRASCH